MAGVVGIYGYIIDLDSVETFADRCPSVVVAVEYPFKNPQKSVTAKNDIAVGRMLG